MDIDKKILFEDYKIFKITEETRKNVLKHSDRYTNCPLKIRMGSFILTMNINKNQKKV